MSFNNRIVVNEINIENSIPSTTLYRIYNTSGDLYWDSINVSSNANKVNNLTAAEISQLENIDTTTISTTQWGYVGNMDQSVSTSDDVTFNQVRTPIISSFNDNIDILMTGNTISDRSISLSALNTGSGKANINLSCDDDINITGLNIFLAGNVYSGNAPNSDLVLRSTTDSIKGRVLIPETTTSSSTTTGALVVSGGIGCNDISSGKMNVYAQNSHIDLYESDNANKNWRLEASNGDFQVTEVGIDNPLKINPSGDILINRSLYNSTLSAYYHPQISTSATGAVSGAFSVSSQWRALKEGSLVSLRVNQTLANATSTNDISLSGVLPANYRPVQDQFFPVRVKVSSVSDAIGICSINSTSGQIKIYAGASLSSFVTGQASGWYGFSVSWNLL